MKILSACHLTGLAAAALLGGGAFAQAQNPPSPAAPRVGAVAPVTLEAAPRPSTTTPQELTPEEIIARMDAQLAARSDAEIAAMPKTIAEAIAAGNTRAVSYLGGTSADLSAALLNAAIARGNQGLVDQLRRTQEQRAQIEARSPLILSRQEDRPAPTFVPLPRSVAEQDARNAQSRAQIEQSYQQNLEAYGRDLETWNSQLADAQARGDTERLARLESIRPLEPLRPILGPARPTLAETLTRPPLSPEERAAEIQASTAQMEAAYQQSVTRTAELNRRMQDSYNQSLESWATRRAEALARGDTARVQQLDASAPTAPLTLTPGPAPPSLTRPPT